MEPRSEMSLGQWRTAASDAFGRLEITTAEPERFRAHARVVSTGDVTLYDMQTPPHTVERRAEDCGAAANYGKLSMQLTGTTTVRQDGRECVLRPGDLAFYVTERPYTLHYPGPQHSLVVKFPQHFVHLPAEDVAAVTATRVSDETGLGRVAVPLFEQLAYNLDVLEGPQAGALVRSALDMLVTVLSSQLWEEGSAAPGGLFREAAAYIEEHLADSELRPATIAEALFVSVRSLHSQFAAHDTSVSAFIRSRRLEMIRRDLADPRMAGETIQAIASRHGLPEASYVSRAFRARYGVAPRAFRRAALTA